MTNYAFVSAGYVQEVTQTPETSPTPTADFVEAPDAVAVGWTRDGDGNWFAPDGRPLAEAGFRKKVSQVAYFGLFTPEEEAEINLIASQEVTKAQVDAADAATKPQLKAVLYLQAMLGRINKLGPHDLIEMDDDQVLAGLGLLVQMNLITAERRAEIARGVPIKAQ